MGPIFSNSSHSVIPAEPGIHCSDLTLDTRFRGYDETIPSIAPESDKLPFLLTLLVATSRFAATFLGG